MTGLVHGTPALRVDNLSKAFAGVKAVQNVSFAIDHGRIHALIGPNGAGKTTLFNLVMGIERPDAGRIVLDELDVTQASAVVRARAGLQRTFQNLELFSELTAVETVMLGRHLHCNHALAASMLNTPSVRRSNREAHNAAVGLLKRVGLADYQDVRPGVMPYGALKRLDIARALAADPKTLLMDEPAAGLNPSETLAMRELIVQIAAESITVLIVEHDMRLVMSVAQNIVVLDHGVKIAQGAPQDIRENPAVIAAYLGGPTKARRAL